MLPWYGKQGPKHRRTTSRVICKKCGAFGEIARSLREVACETYATSRGAQRKNLRQRLQDARDRADTEQLFKDGVNTVFGIWDNLSENVTKTGEEKAGHVFDFLAWPLDGGTRYVCTKCGVLGVRRPTTQCPGHRIWTNKRGKLKKEFTQIAQDGPDYHKAAAKRALVALGFEGQGDGGQGRQ